MNYHSFLDTKRLIYRPSGIEVDASQIHPMLFPFQRDLVRWAARKGRCAVFADCGLGKTFIQLEWARLVDQKTLIVAPLSVARQTAREAHKIDIDVKYVRSQADVTGLISITNYEMVEQFDASQVGAVVLDESSILKSLDGKTRKVLTAMFAETPYRLCCTATPAPNDLVEMGNHAEFLGVCSEAEMRAMFFINANKEHTFFLDGKAYKKKGHNKDGQEWRIKHHAEAPFFQWLSSWAICITKPSDLGYEDDGFTLPPLNVHPVFVNAEYVPEGQLFFSHLHGIGDRAIVRRATLSSRLDELHKIIADDGQQWIIWVGLDEESKAATASFQGAIEVKGSDSPEYKANAFEAFQDGAHRILVTKGKIGGLGMNFQNAHNMAFLGLNDSWESWYQCIRREWRYGQAGEVNVFAVLSDQEAEVWANVMRKDAMATRLRRELIGHIANYEKEELGNMSHGETYDAGVMMRLPQGGGIANVRVITQEHGRNWSLYNGDSSEALGGLPDASIDLSVYSPPFADLYVYTDSERDLGNSRNWAEFFDHYSFIIREVLRVTKPGRLTCVHSSDIPAMASRDGYIGVKDFPGEVIRAYEACGWVFTGRAFVQKNPQAQAIRTKSKALLFVQLRKDSADSRPALVDQILLFKKPGENAVPVNPVANNEMNNEKWIEWAHGIWTGIQETKTLQYTTARGGDDEKHICPLQLETIERCIKLWSNPGETVLSPFAGIGSEGYESIRLGRKFVGIELKPEYYKVGCRNLREIEAGMAELTMFDMANIGQ